MTSSNLLPCPSCARHVRASEPICLFCGAPMPRESERPPAPVPPKKRLTRATLVAFGASVVAFATVACGGETSSSDAGATDGGSDAHEECHPVFTAYGGPPPCR
jgi:hypothetical protein